MKKDITLLGSAIGKHMPPKWKGKLVEDLTPAEANAARVQIKSRIKAHRDTERHKVADAMERFLKRFDQARGE